MGLIPDWAQIWSNKITLIQMLDTDLNRVEARLELESFRLMFELDKLCPDLVQPDRAYPKALSLRGTLKKVAIKSTDVLLVLD